MSEQTDQLRNPAGVKETETESNTTTLLTSLISDEEEKMPDLHQIKDLLHALRIDGQWFKRQIKVILLIVAGIIWYITNRYQAQQEMIEEEKLRKELTDWKWRSMTRTSELTLHTRQTFLEDKLKELGDSTLKTSATPPFILKSN
jgi:hypothetical protein